MAPIFWNKMWLHSWFAHSKSMLQCWGVSCTCSLFPSFLSCPLEQLLEWWDESWGLLLWFKPALNGIDKIQVAQKLLQVVGTGEKGQGWRWGLATASSSSLLFKPLMPLQVLPLQRVGKGLADHLRASLCLSQSSCLLGCLKSQMLCCLNREPRLLPWHRSMLLRTLLLKLRGSNGLKSGYMVWGGGHSTCVTGFVSQASTELKNLNSSLSEIQKFILKFILFCTTSVAEGWGFLSPLGHMWCLHLTLVSVSFPSLGIHFKKKKEEWLHCAMP